MFPDHFQPQEKVTNLLGAWQTNDDKILIYHKTLDFGSPLLTKGLSLSALHVGSLFSKELQEKECLLILEQLKSTIQTYT